MQNIPAAVWPIPCKETQSGTPGVPSNSASSREKSVESLAGATKGVMVGRIEM